MTLAPEYLTSHAPADLTETPFGFPAHPLVLSPEQREVHHHVIGQTLATAAMKEALDTFAKVGDTGTKTHSLGVGWLAVAAGLELGLKERDLAILARGSFGHDVGKTHNLIQPAVCSEETFSHNAQLFRTIQHHPVWGGLMLRELGFGSNEAMLAAAHHGFQQEREPYGITREHVRGFEEADGYVPPTLLMAETVAAADTLHALSVHPALTGRNYMQPNEVSPERAMRAVENLVISREVKQAIGSVAGFSEVSHH